MTRVVLFVSVLLLALAGCTASLADLNDFGKDLEAEGYEVAGLHHNTTNGHSVLVVQAVRPNEVATEEDTGEIAALAWQRFTGDIDELTVTVNADEELTLSNDELTARFGQRPDQVLPEPASGGSKAVYIIVILAVALVGTLLLVLHARRRPPPPPGPPTYHYPPPAHSPDFPSQPPR